MREYVSGTIIDFQTLLHGGLNGYELELQRFRQRFVRLEALMTSLLENRRLHSWLGLETYTSSTNFCCFLGNILWTGHVNAKDEDEISNQIEVEHVYIEGVRKAMKVNANRARRMNAKLYSHDLETFRVQEYCVHHKLDVEQFIEEVYTLQCTLRIWGNEFPVMSNVSNWEVSLLAFEILLEYRLRRHPKGRPQLTRIRNDMDVKETGELKQCTICRTFGHNRLTCPHRVYVRGQISCNVVLKDNE
ncbi:hypothetical protein GOBAR_DD20946 [Gossypium barbadense]|nr:hypothetical protein GOBAR_DD20946 [Gossypium barbadense]